MSSPAADRPQIPGYEVLAPLGAGASSRVWRARRTADRLEVALKVLRPDAGRVGAGQVEAGLREAGLLSRVRHPHLVRLYDVLPVPDPATGRAVGVALATQLAPGGSLGQLLTRRGMLSPGEVVTVLSPIAGVLAQLHQDGLVHGDLSVGNVLFLADGMPLLADLGACRVLGEVPAEVLGTGAASGMVAPEVLEGFAPTPEADVYALGALAWLALVGDAPGPSFARGPLVERSPLLPEELVDLVERSLAPQPDDRPAADEFAASLARAARPEPVEVAPDADPGHGLTQRLRQQVREEEGEDDGARGRGRPAKHRAGRGGPRREGDRRGGAGREGGRRGGAGRAGAGAGAGGRRRLLVAGVAVAGVVLVAAATMVVLRLLGIGWPGSGGDEVAPAAGEVVAATADPGASGEQDAPAAADPGAGAEQDAPAAAEADPEVTSVLQHLVDRRGLAWERTDPDLLGSAMAPDSPALAAEEDALERVRAAEVTYPDVTFRVDAALVAEREEGRMTVEAVLTRAPLTARDAGGSTIEHGAQRSDHVLLELVRLEEVDATDDPAAGWRLWTWSAPTR